MEQQYYIPSLADFRVGYEYEMDAGTGWAKQTFPDQWFHDSAMGGFDELKMMLHYNIRVPYLTAAQIESEGWEGSGHCRFSFPYGGAFQYIMIFLPNTRSACIRRDVLDMMPVVYNGYCRCINDFRLICKLLNIAK